MLNCLVNSIFHILFGIDLAEVLKSSTVSLEPSCFWSVPTFFQSPFFLPPPLNSPWKDFPCWKFWFRYDLWGIPIHCISIVLGLRCWALLFSQLSPHYTVTHARNVGFHLSLSKFCASLVFTFLYSEAIVNIYAYLQSYWPAIFMTCWKWIDFFHF